MTILVHDYLLVHRGAERCLTELAGMFPEAPIASLLYDEQVFAGILEEGRVSTSFLQAFGASQSNFKKLLPLLPIATERLDVSGHDLVISSSSAFAHGVSPDRGATHVCYCYTPFRYAWYEQKRAEQEAPRWARPLVRGTLRGIRAWDARKASRDTHYVAISKISQERIRRYWRRDAPIVYPPVDVDRFSPGEARDYFLFVGELVRHKNVELALEAAELAGVPIKIVGGGTDEDRLKHRYGARAGVEFVGRAPDDALPSLYSGCRALVMPNTEEFGITAVEAQAAGRPVIAADAGGARETVVSDATGLFFPPGDVTALAAAMRDPFLDDVMSADCAQNAARFSAAAFRHAFHAEVEAATSR